MRKVLSFVLVLTLVLGSFSMAFAATPAASLSDVAGKDCEEAVRVLTSLGVVTGYEDGSYKPDQVVTRAEATVIVIKALGLAGSVGTQKSSFTDLSGYGWAEGYIAFATQLGITNGYPDGSFKPGQTVNYNEFATMLVRALGYTDVALTGTWPAKYVNQAAAVGIMDDVKSGGANGANRGDVAIMSNNTLTAYIGSVDKDNNWNPIIKSGSVARGNAVYDTMIGRLGGYYVKDVIDDGATATINVKPYVGKFCEYYTDKENGKGDIIAVAKVLSTTITGSFEDSTITGTDIFVKDVVFEGDDDVDYKMTSSSAKYDDESDATDPMQDAKLYLNGEATTEGAIGAANVNTLEVSLSGKTIKHVYSASAWEAQAKERIEAGDLEDLKDGELLGFDFDLDRNDKIIADSFELIGVNSLDDIKADNVVFVYPDTDDVIRRVAVGTKVVEGELTKVNSSGSKWTIDGTVYKFSNVHANASDAEGYIADGEGVGDDVKVWLDADGRIFEIESVSGAAKDYGIVKDTGSFGQLKLYLATDSTKVFDTDLSSSTNYAPTKGAIVGYGLDKDGAVDTLYPKTTDDADDNYFAATAYTTKVGAGATANTFTAGYLASNKVLNVNAGGTKTYAVKSDVAVFTFDMGDKSYDVAKIADIEKGSSKAGSVLSFLIKKGEVVAIIVDAENATGSSDASYAVISGKSTSKNSVGDKALELEGYIDGKKMSGVHTSGTGTADGLNLATVGAFKIKYNDDGNISKITNEASDFEEVKAPITVLESKTSKGYVAEKPSGEQFALADGAAIYEVKLDGGNVDEYKTFSGTIPDGSTVWLYDTDDDKAGYEIVIILKN